LNCQSGIWGNGRPKRDDIAASRSYIVHAANYCLHAGLQTLGIAQVSDTVEQYEANIERAFGSQMDLFRR
jgi:hypothetical protein